MKLIMMMIMIDTPVLDNCMMMMMMMMMMIDTPVLNNYMRMMMMLLTHWSLITT